jgi:hypothetical protein
MHLSAFRENIKINKSNKIFLQTAQTTTQAEK